MPKYFIKYPSKLEIFNPKMLHKCPHALGHNSNPIDGHRWPIDGIEWSLSTGHPKLLRAQGHQNHMTVAIHLGLQCLF